MECPYCAIGDEPIELEDGVKGHELRVPCSPDATQISVRHLLKTMVHAFKKRLLVEISRNISADCHEFNRGVADSLRTVINSREDV